VRESIARGLVNRVLGVAARTAPGATSLRVWLHRARGVKIGEDTFIGSDALIETSCPHLVSIGRGVAIGIRATLIAHFRDAISADAEVDRSSDAVSIRIDDDAFIGAGAIIMPNVTIGKGAVVTAGSVVTKSVPAMTMVHGNPAEPVARCGVPLGLSTPIKQFYRQLRPLPGAKF
jgi:heptaprenylglycerol acetyltransferase